jgi:hypothetical protein
MTGGGGLADGLCVRPVQRNSKFAAAYQNGVHKKEYWKHTLEDILDVWAKLPDVRLPTTHTHAHMHAVPSLGPLSCPEHLVDPGADGELWMCAVFVCAAVSWRP